LEAELCRIDLPAALEVQANSTASVTRQDAIHRLCVRDRRAIYLDDDVTRLKDLLATLCTGLDSTSADELCDDAATSPQCATCGPHTALT